MNRNFERERLEAIEETQASLKENIETSKRLIMRSETLLESCRRMRGEGDDSGRQAPG